MIRQGKGRHHIANASCERNRPNRRHRLFSASAVRQMKEKRGRTERNFFFFFFAVPHEKELMHTTELAGINTLCIRQFGSGSQDNSYRGADYWLYCGAHLAKTGSHHHPEEHNARVVDLMNLFLYSSAAAKRRSPVRGRWRSHTHSAPTPPSRMTSIPAKKKPLGSLLC